MYFYELLKELDLTAFQQVLEEWHVTKNEQSKYLSFIERLIQKKPILSEDLLHVLFTFEEDGYEDYSAGVLKGEKSFALDFIPWEEVLGYQVNINEQETSRELFAFHVLYDMSFDGFYEEVREESLNNLVSRMDDFEKEEENND